MVGVTSMINHASCWTIVKPKALRTILTPAMASKSVLVSAWHEEP